MLEITDPTSKLICEVDLKSVSVAAVAITVAGGLNNCDDESGSFALGMRTANQQTTIENSRSPLQIVCFGWSIIEEELDQYLLDRIKRVLLADTHSDGGDIIWTMARISSTVVYSGVIRGVKRLSTPY